MNVWVRVGLALQRAGGLQWLFLLLQGRITLLLTRPCMTKVKEQRFINMSEMDKKRDCKCNPRGTRFCFVITEEVSIGAEMSCC